MSVSHSQNSQNFILQQISWNSRFVHFCFIETSHFLHFVTPFHHFQNVEPSPRNSKIEHSSSNKRRKIQFFGLKALRSPSAISSDFRGSSRRHSKWMATCPTPGPTPAWGPFGAEWHARIPRLGQNSCSSSSMPSCLPLTACIKVNGRWSHLGDSRIPVRLHTDHLWASTFTSDSTKRFWSFFLFAMANFPSSDPANLWA